MPEPGGLARYLDVHLSIAPKACVLKYHNHLWQPFQWWTSSYFAPFFDELSVPALTCCAPCLPSYFCQLVPPVQRCRPRFNPRCLPPRAQGQGQIVSSSLLTRCEKCAALFTQFSVQAPVIKRVAYSSYELNGVRKHIAFKLTVLFVVY